MAQWKLWMYVRMLPRLEAQREIRDRRVALSVAGMQIEEHDNARYLRGLEKRASGEDGRGKVADLSGVSGLSVVKE